jgi:hypothetical protein
MKMNERRRVVLFLLFMTSALEVSSQFHSSTDLLPFDRKLGWTANPVWTLWSNVKSLPAGNSVQYVTDHYTDWVTPVRNVRQVIHNWQGLQKRTGLFRHRNIQKISWTGRIQKSLWMQRHKHRSKPILYAFKLRVFRAIFHGCNDVN